MINIKKRALSAALTAVLTASMLPLVPAYAGTDGEQEASATKIIFSYESEGATVKPDKEGNVPELNDLEGLPGDSVRLPDLKLVKEGFTFTGWTLDGVRGYAPGEVMQFLDTDAELKPVWTDKSSEVTYTAEYYVKYDGKLYGEKEKPASVTGAPGTLVEVSLVAYNRDGYKHLGWKLDGETEFMGEQHFIMPDHDVKLTPCWKRNYDLIYTPGDVDRVIGATGMTYAKTETISTDLQASDRFSRSGFELTGWLCDYDGEIYEPLGQFLMPSCDVTMTAVWTPINYKLLFDEGSTSFKVPCTTDDCLTIPENRSEKNGYTFSGWNFDGNIYQPGDEYKVEGRISGLGYRFEAVWTKDSEFPELLGDANGDNAVNLADAVRIMQSVSNPDKYMLCEQAEKNADVDGLSGVTYRDALFIQRYKLGITASLGDETTDAE
ncbi:MAG: dockerin type I repeat-containing protein [Ruminococcus sp.]|nr:dockerin type I repeat-containing protein [Ruminococcus sp.]